MTTTSKTSALAIPTALLWNAKSIAAVVALIWMGVLGHFWWATAWLAAAVFIGPLVLGVIMMPAHFLGGWAWVSLKDQPASPKRTVLYMLPHWLYVAAACVAWCMLSFTYFTSHSQSWADIFLAFAVGSIPLGAVASADMRRPEHGGGGEAAFVLMCFVNLAFVSLIGYALLIVNDVVDKPDSVLPFWVLFSIVVAIGVVAVGALAMSVTSPAPQLARSMRRPSLWTFLRRKPPAPAVAQEVQDCLRELDAIEADIKANGLSYLGLPEDEIFSTVRTLISNPELTLQAVREDKVSPKAVAWLVISNVTGRALASGQYHVYRNVLGMNGRPMLALYLRAISELEKMGFYEGRNRSAADDRVWVGERIAEAG